MGLDSFADLTPRKLFRRVDSDQVVLQGVRFLTAYVSAAGPPRSVTRFAPSEAIFATMYDGTQVVFTK